MFIAQHVFSLTFFFIVLEYLIKCAIVHVITSTNQIQAREINNAFVEFYKQWSGAKCQLNMRSGTPNEQKMCLSLCLCVCVLFVCLLQKSGETTSFAQNVATMIATNTTSTSYYYDY